MNNFKGVDLIGDVFGSAKIGHELIFAQFVLGDRIVIEVQRNAARAVDVDRSIVETKPGPKIARDRRVCSEMFQIPVHDMGWSCTGQRAGQDGAESPADIDQTAPRLEKRVGELLRADLDDRQLAVEVSIVS